MLFPYISVWWPREIHIYNNGPELRLKAVGRCICNCKAEEHMRKREMGEKKLHLIVECVLKTLIFEKNHTWSLRILKLILFKAVMCKVCIRNLLYTLWISFFKDPLFSCCQLQELQHNSPPCPSLSPWVCSNSCPLSWWCHPTISSTAFPFASWPQSFPASGVFINHQNSVGSTIHHTGRLLVSLLL